MFEIEIRQEKGLINWDFSTYKKQLEMQLKKYQGLVVTDDSIKESKDTKANLNKVAKVIDDERKRIKKLYCEPLEVFENQAKELTGMITQVSKAIDDQIKAFDELERAAKKEQIEQFFNEMRFFLVPLERLFDEKWLNKTVSDKQWKEQLSSKIETIKVILSVINNMPVEDQEPIKLLYLETLDLGVATQRHNSNKALKERLAQSEFNKPTSAETVQEVQMPIQTETSAELLVKKFWAEGTYQMFVELGEYMKQKGFTFGKVE